MRVFLLLAWLMMLMGFLPANAAQEPPLSYQQYLGQVLEYYPSLKKQNANIDKAISEKALAGSTRLPEFWSSAEFQYGNDPVYVFGALLRQNKFMADDFSLNRLNQPKAYANNTASIQGQWLVFDFLQTAKRIKTAGLLVESQEFQANMLQMEAILAASEMYSRLSLTQRFLKELMIVCSQGARDIAQVQNLAKTGLVLGADFYLARMSQTKLLQLKNETMAQEAALRMVFNVLRGMDPATAVKLNTDAQSKFSLQGDVKLWVKKSLENRPDIKAIIKQVEAQGISLQKEKNSYLPQISAFGQVDQNAHSLNQSGSSGYGVGLKATMNIFDPGYSSRVKKVKADEDILKNQYLETKDQAVKDAVETFYQLQSLKLNKDLAFMALGDAGKAVKLMDPLYAQGKKSVLDMLSIRTGYAQAYDHWLKMEYAWRQQILALKLYAGELTQKEAIEIYGQ